MRLVQSPMAQMDGTCAARWAACNSEHGTAAGGLASQAQIHPELATGRVREAQCTRQLPL